MSLIAPGWATSLPLQFLSNFKSYNSFLSLFIYHILTFYTGIEAPGRRGEEDVFSTNVIHCPRMGFPVKELSEEYFKKILLASLAKLIVSSLSKRDFHPCCDALSNSAKNAIHTFKNCKLWRWKICSISIRLVLAYFVLFIVCVFWR